MPSQKESSLISWQASQDEIQPLKPPRLIIQKTPPQLDPNSPVLPLASVGPQGYDPYSSPPASQQGYTRRNQYRLREDQRASRRTTTKQMRSIPCGCLAILIVLICLLLSTTTYVLFPGRTNVLLLGIDYADPGSYVSRTDTIILATFLPRKPMVHLLSIPRDLWVNIPGVGENRINTAHFYAESQQPGSGPQAVIQTIEDDFGVKMDYYLRIRFEGFRDIVDALGGVDIILDEPTAGYPVGTVHLTGHKALAFVRDRANSDDFSRMSNGQLMLRALYVNALKPEKWLFLPAAAHAFFRNIDTNLPVWMIPRLVIMTLLTGPEKINYNVLPREMVTPLTTSQGASVLQPNWNLIHLLIKQIFF